MSSIIFQKRLKFVNKIISLAKNETDLEQKIYLLENVNYYMTNNHCGVFRYEPMEDLLQNIGTNFIVDKEESYTKNTFLHIMTKASVTGGHTRVVENFINNRKNYDESHSILLVSQNIEEKPSFIQEIESDEHFFDLSSLNILEKIKKISFLANQYEYIVLHHHMYDIVPIIALSQFKDTKKIFAYNHADHLYWVGSSIITGSFEMSSDGMNFSKHRRGIENTILLPIPLEQKNKIVDLNLKKRLNISLEKKIVLTIGSMDRFRTNGYSYKDMLNHVLEDDKIVFIIIGNHTKEFWKDLWNHENIRFEGLVPKEKLEEYYAIADIYVDTFPMGGGTATLDAICYNIPSIKIKHIFFEFDSLKPFVVDKEDVAEKIIDLLKNKNKFKLNNINQHFKYYFNKILDSFEVVKLNNIPNNYGVLQQYDIDLFNFQNRQQAHRLNGFIKNLNFKNKLKYIFSLFIYTMYNYE